MVPAASLLGTQYPGLNFGGLNHTDSQVPTTPSGDGLNAENKIHIHLSFKKGYTSLLKGNVPRENQQDIETDKNTPGISQLCISGTEISRGVGF